MNNINNDLIKFWDIQFYKVIPIFKALPHTWQKHTV